MYAVFEDGSHQYRVSEGDRVRIDYRDVPHGSEVVLDRVLLYANGDDTRIGRPTVPGAKIIAEIIERPEPDDKRKSSSVKTVIQKFRRRKNYVRLTGHRQPFVHVKVKQIVAG